MKLNFPATARNRDPILAVLREWLVPPITQVIEVASGSGEHAVHFADALPWVRWQPTDIDPAHLASIDAWAGAHPRIRPALRFDTTTDTWPPGTWDAVFCANMVHIAPWAAAAGLFRGAASALRPGGLLVTYGPYQIEGAHTAPSNEAFDASLKARDSRWGVRDVAALAALDTRLTLVEKVAMPANNFMLRFQRAEG